MTEIEDSVITGACQLLWIYICHHNQVLPLEFIFTKTCESPLHCHKKSQC